MTPARSPRVEEVVNSFSVGSSKRCRKGFGDGNILVSAQAASSGAFAQGWPQATPTHMIQALMCTFLGLFWLGCLAAPMRVPTHTQGPSGKHTNTDLSFLRIGSTTRGNVVQHLGWADSQLKNGRLFLARWRDSKWVVAWAVGGGYSGTGGAPRLWHTHNLAVEFDEKDVVTAYHEFGDDALAKELLASLERTKTSGLDFSSPVVLSIKHRRGQHYEPATLSLSKDSFEVTKPDMPSSDFKIAPQQIIGFTFVNGLKEESPDPQSTNYTFHFREKTKVGKNLTIRVDIPTLAILVQYLAENGTIEGRHVQAAR